MPSNCRLLLKCSVATVFCLLLLGARCYAQGGRTLELSIPTLIEQMLKATGITLGATEAWAIHMHAGLTAADKCVWSDAESAFTAALKEAEKIGTENLEVANSLNALGGVQYALARYTESEASWKRAGDIIRKLLPEDKEALGMITMNMGVLSYARGNYSDAEKQYKDAIATFEKAGDSAGANLALAEGNLAVIYTTLNRYDESEPLLVKTLANKEKIFGAY